MYYIILLPISLLLLKMVDVFWGFIIHEAPEQITQSGRSIALREQGISQSILLRPTDDFIKITLSLTGGPFKVGLDQDGFILGAEEYENEIKNKESVDLYFMGGSTTENLYVNEPYRFPTLVGQILTEDLGRPIKAVNAGMSGNNTMHSTFSFMAKGLPMKPKYVVIMHNVNDWVQLARSGSYHSAPSSRKIMNSASEVSLKKYYLKLFKDSFVPNIWNYMMSTLVIGGKSEWGDDFQKTVIEADEIERIYLCSLNAMIEIARSWQVDVILMTQPSIMKQVFVEDADYLRNISNFDPNFMIHMQDTLNNAIRRLGVEKSLIVIDAEKVNLQRDYFYDTHHLNDNGNEAFAKYIASQLKQVF